jgi:uncharacterized protein (DUF2384 family)
MDKKMRNRILEVKGIRTFESKKNYYKWFNKPCRALGGKIPAELVETPEGLQMVLDQLDRMEYGLIS